MPNSVTPPRPLRWDPSIAALQTVTHPDEDVYLVGGTVRDAYLNRPFHDIDLATPGDGRPLARRIANHFKGAYYSLDSTRGVGRALISWENNQLAIDVAQFRGPDLLTDLKKRDFTLNALAVKLTGDLQTVYDPTGGLKDLQNKQLRQCSPTAISDDPIRALRAIRASITFRLTIEPHTRTAIKAHAPALGTISAERIRDELFQLLGARQPAPAIAAMQHLGLLQYIIPETTAMQDIEQPPPHQFNLWQHTLKTVEYLDTLLHVIGPRRDRDLTANVQAAAAASILDLMREPLRAHLTHSWPNERTHKSLLMLAALMHDSGKPAAQTIDEEGRIHFYQHEIIGEHVAEARAQALHLSNSEITRLTTIIHNHMRPHWLSDESTLSRRAIYRFWRDTEAAGIDVCLLAMADYLATYGVTLDPADWTHYLERIHALLAYYFEQSTSNSTTPLLSGKDLLEMFDLQPGPQIGTLLEHLREAQAIGEINNKKEAQDWVLRFLNDRS